MLTDVFLNALRNLVAKPAKTIFTMMGTVIAVACLIGITCISQTAAGQIDKNFNELQATHITILDTKTKNSESSGFSFTDTSEQTINSLNGIESSGIYFTAQVGDETHPASINKMPSISVANPKKTALAVIGISSGFGGAADIKLRSGVPINSFHIDTSAKVALLGGAAAKSLGIEQSDIESTVFINDDAYSVIGILDNNDLVPAINSAVLLPISTTRQTYGDPQPVSPAQMIVQTKMGAADLISKQAALALSPKNPNAFSASLPPDWSKFTSPISDSVQMMTLIMIIIAFISACVSIATIASLNVNSRKKEIGILKALGANKLRIFLVFLFESIIVGLIGGIIGNTIGIISLLTVCFINQWTPLFNIIFCLLSPLIGAVIGGVSAIIPALRASQLNPIVALAS